MRQGKVIYFTFFYTFRVLRWKPGLTRENISWKMIGCPRECWCRLTMSRWRGKSYLCIIYFFRLPLNFSFSVFCFPSLKHFRDWWRKIEWKLKAFLLSLTRVVAEMAKSRLTHSSSDNTTTRRPRIPSCFLSFIYSLCSVINDIMYVHTFAINEIYYVTFSSEIVNKGKLFSYVLKIKWTLSHTRRLFPSRLSLSVSITLVSSSSSLMTKKNSNEKWNFYSASN